MYEEFFGLTEKPFSIQPDPSFLYWGRGHRLAYAMLEYGVVNQAGISVITGEVGCGKTTLIHWLLNQLSDTHTIALLSNIQAGRGDLLSWVLMGFGEPYAGKTHVEMFSQLQNFFIREYARGKRVVLIIDEAQNLSIDMLEEIRMLSNINAGKDQLLQLILVGQPQLKDLLSRPDMLQLAQRIGSDFHLTPLTREETHAYIETRLMIAGGRDNVFSSEAMDLVAEHSRGVPRVINTIADTALVYAFSAQEPIVSAETVRNVIRDKLDYGVFGLASSPDLKLAERDTRRGAGFLPAEAPVKAEPAAISIRQSFKSRDAAPAPTAYAAPEEEPIVATASLGGPSLYEFHAPRVEKPAVVERPRPRLVEETAEPVAATTEARSAPAADGSAIGVVIVGANDRLAETLASIADAAPAVVVARTGSAEAAAAKEAGIETVEIDGADLNGGRARNAGYRRLKKIAPALKFAQFVNSGVEIDGDWLTQAARFMARRPEVAVLEGRMTLRTKSGKPLADTQKLEDDCEIQAAGPNALFRADAFEAAGGFRGDIIADETADLCIRLRRRGAHVWRSDDQMAIAPRGAETPGAWRRRAVEDGFAYAAGAALHGGPPERYFAREQARAVVWGAALPVAILAATIAGGIAMAAASGPVRALAFALFIFGAGVGVYAFKIIFFAASRGLFSASAWTRAIKDTWRHFYEFAGVARYWFSARKRPAPRKAAG